MKKATQYVYEHFDLTKPIEDWDDFDSIRYYSNKFPSNTNNLLMGEIYDLIKKVQEEVIRETVEECANSAITREAVEYWSGQVWDDGPLPIVVDKNSILSIADKLIKEL